MKILYYEPEKDIGILYSNFLREKEFVVDTVGTKREAMAKIKSEKYDLMIMDVNDSTGNDFIEEIKGEKIPVIFTTASVLDFSEYEIPTLYKPFESNELLDLVCLKLRDGEKALILYPY